MTEMSTRESLVPPRAESGFMIKVLMALFVASIGLLGVLAPSGPFAAPQAGAQVALGYADRVETFAPGLYHNTSCAPDNQGGTGSAVLGAPNYDETISGGTAALGEGGVIVVRMSTPFGGSGDDSHDIYVWEVGAGEDYTVEVSPDGVTWTYVGEIGLGTPGEAGYDIDWAGFDEFDVLQYVRITDIAPTNGGCWTYDDATLEFTGVDIDAIGVLTRPIYADLEIVKSHDVADGTVLAIDDVIEYTFEVTNTGTVDLTGVSVSDPLPGLRDMTPATADIPVGDSVTFTALYDVTQDDIDAGEIVNQATATGVPPLACTQCVPPDVPSNREIIELPQDPALEIVKASDIVDGETVDVGDVIEYTFEVTNIGNVTITDVVITDPMADLTWVTGPDLGDLAPGASATGTATYVVTEADILAGQIVNAATATGTPPDSCTGDCDPTSPPDDEVVITEDPDPAIAIDKESDVEDGETVAEGDTVTYTFEVTNTGNVTLTDVTVDDDLEGLSDLAPASVASLVPGRSTTFTATYVVTAADVLAGQIVNTATSTGNPPDDCTDCEPPVSPPDDEIVTTEDPEPGLSIDKESNVAEDAVVHEGDTITYTFTVVNTGNITLTSVSVADGLEGLSGIDPDSVASLAPGATAEFTATYTVDADDIAAGVIVNAATATGSCGDDCSTTSTPDEEIVTTANPAMTIDKESNVADDETVAEGDTITYTFVVTNTGNVDLTGVMIDDNLEGLSDISPASADILVGGSATFSATYTVDADDIVAGEIVNAATATGSCGDDCTVTTPPDEEIVTTEDPEPGLSIDKESDVADGETVGEGDTVTYTFTVTNTGDVDLTGVTIDDPLPGLSATNPASADIAAGESVTFTATYVVTAADVQAGSIVNAASATGSCGNECSTESPPDEEIVTTEDPDPALAIDKESDVADGATVAEGDTVTYTFTVTNTGNVTLTNVSVTDSLEGLSAITPASVASLAPGAETTFSATYVVTAADAANGSIVNSATSTGSCGPQCTTTSPPDEETVTVTTPPTEVPPTEVPPTEVLPTEVPPTEVPPTEVPPTEEPTQVPAPALTLDKQASTAGPVPAGFALTYYFVVQNVGNVAIPDVTISDPLPGLTWVVGPNLGTLQPGESAIGSATYIVTEADAAAGAIVNRATVDCAQGGCVPNVPVDEETIESCTVQGMENETGASQPGIRTFRQLTTEEPVIPTEEPVIPTEEPVVTEAPVIPTEEPVIPTEEPVVTEAPAPTEEPAATEAAEDAAAAGGVTEDPCAPPPTEAPPTDPPSQPGGGNNGGSSGGGSSDGGPVISVLPSTGHTDAGTGQLASTATFLALAIVAFTMLGAAAVVRRTRRD